MSQIRKSGGYRKLASFQTATLIYDATFHFCERFIDSKSRTVDQMVQAARSGRQNIAEGSRIGATTSKLELNLTNVARASMEELLLDYEDYLRHRKLPQWQRSSVDSNAVRNHYRTCDDQAVGDRQRWEAYAHWLEHEDPIIRANATICLIHQANFLLDRQVAALEKQFVTEGGYSENLAAARLEERSRKRNERADPDSESIPSCPKCRKPMTLRTARQGENSGSQFWGCTGYPDCKGTVRV